ncbi:hypothetical protein [Paenibacillus polymyxa]|uniref:Uncharacterized protein n=1 Tax=Paenibacillus polymyxa (strain SC2) TaxID=886882 RepID=E3ELB1_PAEPS|nr:hypothetical protein [Paenibacillus polymyxa]ADO59943.1 hypothetical protein PPSC2_28465 [Paenibacillus polymyxa SC2]WPQ59837.1 hypothetical protein SKN87_26475 [Paenibacillus polymyxa]
MYIVEVETNKGKIRGVALQDQDGSIAIITGVHIEVTKKWFKHNKKVCYEVIQLESSDYTSYTIISELGSYEKTCMYELLNDDMKHMFTSYYKNELLQTNLFWNKVKLLIIEQNLTLTELSVVHELFRDGFAKENIVGLEVSNDDRRVSFNLTEQEGVQHLMQLIQKAVMHGELVAKANNVKIIDGISSQLKIS